MSSHIGIVGVSPEGAALFYRLLARHASRLRSPHDQPRISIHNEPLAMYIEAIRRDDWHGVGKLLRRSADLLARCGASFCLTPDNAVQHGVQLAEVGSPIPWLTMPDLVGQAVQKDQRRTVGILGTKLVTHSSTYQTHLGLRGIRVLAPDDGEANDVDQVIFGELIYGDARPESRQLIANVLRRLCEKGCEAVILASSEIPLVVSAEESPCPLYDSADILALSAVERTMKPAASTLE